MMAGALESLEDALPLTRAFQPLRVGVIYRLHGHAAAASAAGPSGPELGAWSPPALYTAAWCLANQGEWDACFPLADEAAKRLVSDPEVELGHDRAALFGLAAHHMGEHALAVASFRRSFELNIGFPSVWLSVFAGHSALLAGVDESELHALQLAQRRVLEQLGAPMLAPEIAATGAIAALENKPERAKAQFEAAVKAASESSELSEVKKLAGAVRAELGRRVEASELDDWLAGFIAGVA